MEENTVDLPDLGEDRIGSRGFGIPILGPCSSLCSSQLSALPPPHLSSLCVLAQAPDPWRDSDWTSPLMGPPLCLPVLKDHRAERGALPKRQSGYHLKRKKETTGVIPTWLPRAFEFECLLFFTWKSNWFLHVQVLRHHRYHTKLLSVVGPAQA